jgi:hypothetical protein
MAIRVASFIVAAAMVGIPAALAAEDPLQKPLYEICLAQDAGWIGKSEAEINANCTCKAKTEASMASPEFRDAILTKGAYEGGAFPFGDYEEYQRRVLTDCPKLQPLMIEALCGDPAAPPDCRRALEEMISKLK